LVNLGAADTGTLVSTLEHTNGWHRDTASRLLYERQDKSAVPLLAKLVRESKSPLAKHHALGVLDGLGALNEEAVLTTLADADPRVRERAILMAEKLIARGGFSAAMADKLSALTDDGDDRVRFKLAFTLEAALAKVAPASGGASENAALTRTNETLTAAYAKLASRDFADSWISAALLSGRPEIVTATLFPVMTRNAVLAKKAAPFMAKLIEIRAASKPAEGYASLIDFVAQPGTSPLWLRALGEGLRRAGSSIEQADTGRKLAAVFTRAASTSADTKAASLARLEAIEILGVASFAQSREALVACLAPGQPAEVQVAAIKTLAQHTGPEVTPTLLRGWPQYSAPAKQAALAALTGREDRTTALLTAIEKGMIAPGDLSASQIESLARHKNAKLAAHARKALASVIPPSREEVAAKFKDAAALRGDASRGKVQYLGRCMVCHRAEGQGMEIGPDLVTVKSKGRDALLAAIIDPHKEVAPQYIAYEVNTKDGASYTGMIARDDATGLALKIMGGAEIAIPRANVKGSSSSGKSLMPDGLEAGLSVQDMADLLTYIEELK
jgi:putative heme-binding domain-containing protein